MGNKIIFSNKLNDILLSQESLSLLLTKGLSSFDDFIDSLIDSINHYNPKLNISNIVFQDIKLDTYSGLIHDETEKPLGYLFLIPPKLGTRSGFLSQQVLGFLSNVIKAIEKTPTYEVSNLPIYILNSDVEDIILSKAINIVGARILGFHFIDLYGRDEKSILLEKYGEVSFKSIAEFDNLLKLNGVNEYFDLDISNSKIIFKTDRLKNLQEPLTNEPYYFGIKALPALCLASKESFDIDLTAFDVWYPTGTNKNVKSFYEYANKLKSINYNFKQKIFYGAPGTGKSYLVDKIIEGKNISADDIFRITFHPEYTYSDFIGQLLPTVEDNNGEKNISYKFNKGVFTQAIQKAYFDTSKEVYLILEEMSRGDVASIFGDVFQLLDRHKVGSIFGYSRYFVNNDVIAKDITYFPGNKIKLPPNLIIMGTVNTSDQNVFVMDTAFKRRFEWEYVSVKPIKNTTTGLFLNNASINYYDLDNTKKASQWVEFYMKLNKFISSKDYLDLGEDKQIGQFFIEFSNKDNEEFVSDSIKNKLLQYLWSDIHKASFKRDISLFSEDISSFSELYDSFSDNKNVFSAAFIQLLNS
ncbi:AAA family ATPase [Tenacibaculum sp. HL-MS23]|uniref:McrB family protein n=1 Tax=Tenacibaculum sp. HL-MS23 TaxID=3077734 RepID=UPI0028FC122E|nr:AAA family ATPase [Tenacibaculum sp. HL-MS23]WNW01867.1 AAA family ATPase [Tenacibaculum sp. HL-MS23]